MILKTAVLLLVYFGSYTVILTGNFPLYIDWLLCIVMGMGMAGLGFSVAHDAIHGAYSKNTNVNYGLGLVMNIIGGNRYVWSITHNIIHHTYTNIYAVDEDLEIAPFIRLSEHAKHKPIHRLQHIVGFLAYGFATLFWVMMKDFKKIMQKNIGPYKNKKHSSFEIALLIFFKLIVLRLYHCHSFVGYEHNLVAIYHRFSHTAHHRGFHPWHYFSIGAYGGRNAPGGSKCSRQY